MFRAITALQDGKYVHRDLKPPNVMLKMIKMDGSNNDEPEPIVYFVDFGAAEYEIFPVQLAGSPIFWYEPCSWLEIGVHQRECVHISFSKSIFSVFFFEKKSRENEKKCTKYATTVK